MDQINLFDIFDNKAESNEQLNFIDLFAGIGGFHHALNKLNMNCVFASEIDVAARQTYLNKIHLTIKKINVLNQI